MVPDRGSKPGIWARARRVCSKSQASSGILISTLLTDKNPRQGLFHISEPKVLSGSPGTCPDEEPPGIGVSFGQEVGLQLDVGMLTVRSCTDSGTIPVPSSAAETELLI